MAALLSKNTERQTRAGPTSSGGLVPPEDNPGCLPEGKEGEVTDLGDSEGPPR